MSYFWITTSSWRWSLAILCVLLTPVSHASAELERLDTINRQTRTDSIQEKLRLIQQASDQNNYDLALSLAESLKETLGCEKQMRAELKQPQLGVDKIQTTDQLPRVWCTWAQGWKYVQSVTLRESANLTRRQEPVDLRIAVRADQSTDLHREIRVAKIEASSARLLQIPSQVYGAVRRGHRRLCHLVFFADVPAGKSVTYLIFHGNPLAERPHYPTDLQVTGDHYAREIANHHYVATLSKQMGQLERLRYTRQHGLELYAGGKGHGEPPTIDWSNDYVDQDQFQKLRIRNWSKPPNYHVIYGPLVVRVRRWGFPHSPIHPVYTPSRLHIDQTYVFYAGHDYFLKEGVMEGIKDFNFSALRDDEWVFSGYSFNRKVWIDSQGKLQEGEVPQTEGRSMGGVGFYHNVSRDALVALWIEHSIQGHEQIERNGVPTLHYHQHGQLWSRYPVGSGTLKFLQGTILRQKNAYLVAPYPKQEAAHQIEGLRNRLLQPLQVTDGKIPYFESANSADDQLARPGETESTAPLKRAIWQALRKVQDEQLYRIDANVVDLGYIYDVRIKDGVAEILMTMPHRGRPVYQYFVTQGGGHTSEGIRERLLQLEGVRDVLVHFTWEPAWTTERLTDAGRRSLGLE
jgi:metal-sulfur cluster biosynthetic enzyme